MQYNLKSIQSAGDVKRLKFKSYWEVKLRTQTSVDILYFWLHFFNRHSFINRPLVFEFCAALYLNKKKMIKKWIVNMSVFIMSLEVDNKYIFK